MHAAQMPRHPDDIDLTWEQVCAALAALKGSRVGVRVVEHSDSETLLAVFKGNLSGQGHGKQPAVFWPVCPSSGQEPAPAQDADTDFQRDRDHQEDAGFYLHRDRFEGAVGRAGCTVLAIIQGSVLINIRQS